MHLWVLLFCSHTLSEKHQEAHVYLHFKYHTTNEKCAAVHKTLKVK